jgi:hypothetical protein
LGRRHVDSDRGAEVSLRFGDICVARPGEQVEPTMDSVPIAIATMSWHPTEEVNLVRSGKMQQFR